MLRGPSPLPAYGAYEAALESPINSLPHTEFPKLNESGGYIAPYRPESSCFSPMPTRDYQQEAADETASIISQVSSSFNSTDFFATEFRNYWTSYKK